MLEKNPGNLTDDEWAYLLSPCWLWKFRDKTTQPTEDKMWKIFSDLNDFKRRYPNVLTAKEVEELSDYELKRYVREQLWDKKSLELFNIHFDKSSFEQQQETDFHCVIDILKALETLREEDPLRDIRPHA